MNDVLQLLWENNTPSGRAIVLIVAILAFFGAACAWWHSRRYAGRERRWLENVRDRLHRAQEARQQPQSSEGEPAAAGPYAPTELRELADGVPQQTLVGDRLATIGKMKQARARVNIDALQQSTILKESARWTLSFPAYVVSLVMMLGLLGTFIGLSLMVVDIHNALPHSAGAANANDWAASVSSLGRILAGKKTAFSATLAGLFASIVVSALNFGLARRQSAFYDRLERFTAEELLPAVVPAFDDETPWEKLSTQLGDSFEHLQNLTVQQGQSVEQIAAVERTFGIVIDNIEKITQRAATAPLQGLTGEMTNVIGQLSEVNNAVIALADKLPQLIGAFRQTHQATLHEIKGAMQAQQATLERFVAAIGTSRVGGRTSALTFAAGGAAFVLLIVFILQRLG